MSQNPLPLITVRSASSWTSYDSVDEAISAADRDFAETVANTGVSAAMGSVIEDVDWSNNAVSFSFSNAQRLILQATPGGIVATVDGFACDRRRDTTALADAVILRIESPSYLCHWDRADILNKRRGSIFCGFQLSGQIAFLNASGNKTLMFSILEAVNGCNERQLILYWNDAE
ncbi:MAG: hypothetical protein KF861_07285 [Planctomycetaceae bacterium]|nr:hypothetical protein [Planctomycetaceae bacterium]